MNAATGVGWTPGLDSAAPPVRFDHLERLTDHIGLFEHAEFIRPRVEHGYCVDDVARGLLVTTRQPGAAPRHLVRTYLDFVLAAQEPDGTFHNRRGTQGEWQDDATVEDCWGRALWGLGSLIGRAPQLVDQLSLRRARRSFERGAALRSPDSRSMVFAGLGAAEVLRSDPRAAEATAAAALLAAAVVAIGSPGGDDDWVWPEDRLRYANAALPEVLILAGHLLGDDRALDDGLRMLRWLVAVESSQGHVSVTPVEGWASGEPRPGFDQQPIEVAALADACATAYDVTEDPWWRDQVHRCVAWFLGANDARVSLIDPVSGGGCDGLLVYGRNENQGAESTLALISTLQQAHRLTIAVAA